ncbi:hypothetical protein ColKHC_08997 [Colletotrichum higginsianum]|nr:hypothetical protein ColKHC_08997 [Colletotrichum higginsianum]
MAPRILQRRVRQISACLQYQKNNNVSPLGTGISNPFAGSRVVSAATSVPAATTFTAPAAAPAAAAAPAPKSPPLVANMWDFQYIDKQIAEKAKFRASLFAKKRTLLTFEEEDEKKETAEEGETAEDGESVITPSLLRAYQSLSKTLIS